MSFKQFRYKQFFSSTYSEPCSSYRTELNNKGTSVPFSEVLETSMCQSNSTQAWCEECNKYQLQQQMRTYQSLPNTLVVNTGLDNAQVLLALSTALSSYAHILLSFITKVTV